MSLSLAILCLPMWGRDYWHEFHTNKETNWRDYPKNIRYYWRDYPKNMRDYWVSHQRRDQWHLYPRKWGTFDVSSAARKRPIDVSIPRIWGTIEVTFVISSLFSLYEKMVKIFSFNWLNFLDRFVTLNTEYILMFDRVWKIFLSKL